MLNPKPTLVFSAPVVLKIPELISYETHCPNPVIISMKIGLARKELAITNPKKRVAALRAATRFLGFMF